ncbi:MAG TPA: BatA domain-containing protein [Saprospiraceae bacterium]|nr:BatA domain-containing protein [Saprospiraceae bacterium]HMP15337.1 BatA domain-containing protein [Saprospiraceae bacterium]
MQFLYPTFLFALFTLAIPIILHLFYFRRFKRVYFTNVRFLREVKEETSARSRLRNLLVLLMRLLTLLFLVLAFAQPFIPQDTEVKQGRKGVSIFMDNSFSMTAMSQNAPLLERARQRAREIVQAYSEEDEFQILTNDFEGRHQRLVSKEDALGLIEEIKISPATRELSKVLARQQQALRTGKAESQIAYIVSDFQKNITDLNTFQDTTLELNLVPLQAVQERNVGVDSVWFDSPVQMLNQTNNLLVSVRNYSREAIDNVRLSIRYEGQTKPVGTLSIPPLSARVDTVPITILRTGWHDGELAITDYPVQFDDKFFFAFNVAEAVRVLLINDNAPNVYLDAAFAGMPGFKADNQLSRNINYTAFPSYQLIVLQDLPTISSGLASELRQYVNKGGNVLVFPSRQADINAYRSFLAAFPAADFQVFEELERSIGTINMEEFVFRDVFENRSANLKLPVTKGNFRSSRNAIRGEESLLTYRDGSPFLSKYRIGQGNLYLCAAPLNEQYSNLAQSGEIFVPMLYKMAISSARAQKIAYTIGQDESIEADHTMSATEAVYKLRGASGEFIPEQRIIGSKVFLGIGNQILQAGFYDMFLSADTTLAKYAFNYDRKESVLDYFTPAELRAQVGATANVIDIMETAALTAKIEERSRGILLWRWCLLLALLFIAVEVLLLRFWKV